MFVCARVPRETAVSPVCTISVSPGGHTSSEILTQPYGELRHRSRSRGVLSVGFLSIASFPPSLVFLNDLSYKVNNNQLVSGQCWLFVSILSESHLDRVSSLKGVLIKYTL